MTPDVPASVTAMVSRWPVLAVTTIGESSPTPWLWFTGVTAITGGGSFAGAPATWTVTPATGAWVPGKLHDVNTNDPAATLPTKRAPRPSLVRSAMQFHRTIVRSQVASGVRVRDR